jgi:FkbM family methyltransferase
MIPLRIRRFVEYISRGISFSRRMPNRFRRLKLHVSPGASLCFYKPLTCSNWNDLYDFAENNIKPGDIIWDVGANMGVLTFAAAARAGTNGRVLAVEPDSWSINHLRHSVRVNRRAEINVDVLQAAVSDRLSIEALNIPQRNRAASHLENAGGAGEQLVGGIRERHLVVTVTLDWIAQFYPAPSILKIDVDGGEMRVLLGGRNLLVRCKPIILTEVYERNADAVTDFLHELGYTLFDYDRGAKGKIRIERALYNTLALPSDHRGAKQV